MADDWISTDRPTGEVLKHAREPYWVVHYGETNRMGEHWQAYKAIAHIPKGREPWSVDNRRIGPDSGFKSLEEAKQAVEQCLTATS